MASLLNSYDSKLTKPLPKTLMLKDYLLDDLSSCSTNGFRSYPRHRCCTTVRFLIDLEIDSKSRDSNRRKISFLRSKSRTASATMTAFQRASEALIHAVKRLQSPASKLLSSPKQGNAKNSSLPRSLSRKLLIKRCSWKRNDEKNDRWKSIKKSSPVGEEKKSSGFFPSVATAAVTTNLILSTSESHCSDSNRWTDMEFNSDNLQCSSGSSENSCEINVGKWETPLPVKAISKRLDVTAVENSIEATPPTSANSKNEWTKEEDKDQFSPVSVLDFPLDDVEEVSSPFQLTLTTMKGTEQELTPQKNRQFAILDLLEPVVLDKQFSVSESADESLESRFQDENDAQRRAATDLLELLKESSVRSSTSELTLIKLEENLLLDFFRERLLTESESCTESVTSRSKSIDCVMMIVSEARDWMNGDSDHRRRRQREMVPEWELQKNGKTCVREMAMEMEVEVVSSLVNELVLDLFEVVT